MTFSAFLKGLLRKVNYTKITLILFVFLIFTNHECEAKKRYKIVVLPFKDYAQMNMEEMVPDVLRSTFAQTGYFKPVDRETTYEKVNTLFPSNMIKLDNVKKGIGGAWTTDQVDLMSRLDTKTVEKFGRQLKADYVLKGSVSLIGSTVGFRYCRG